MDELDTLLKEICLSQTKIKPTYAMDILAMIIKALKKEQYDIIKAHFIVDGVRVVAKDKLDNQLYQVEVKPIGEENV